MVTTNTLGGTFTFPDTDLTVKRMGYGAMQLAGPHVTGPPKDKDAAISVLRTALERGVDHIDTSDFYGPHVTNQIIKDALHPYADDLTIVTKLGARREDSKWLVALSRQELIDGLHDNLRNLGLERMNVVNLRVGPPLSPADASIEEPMTVLAELQQQGLIEHIGLSTVTARQIEEGQKIAPVVCVQNEYNIAKRADDALIASLAKQGIAYVPYFPLGGFTPLQASALDEVAKELGSTPMIVALAWLLGHSPNLLLIPGTSSVKHLEENLSAAELVLPKEMVEKLDAIGAAA